MSNELFVSPVGNLTADPELRYTQEGVAVVNFTIAQTPRVYDRTTNGFKDGEAVFLRATAWRELAEHIAASLTKGQPVMAQGQLKQRSYETTAGEKRTVLELEVSEIGPRLTFGTTVYTKSDGARRAAPAPAAAVAAPVAAPVAAAPVAAAPVAAAPRVAAVATVDDDGDF